MSNTSETKKVSFISVVNASIVAGALKVCVQILIALIIYSIIIRQAGAGALGSWVLLQMFVGYGGLAHLGMAPVIVKEVAISAKSGKDAANASSLSEALSGAMFIVLSLTIVITFLFDPILDIIQEGIDQQVSPMCIWIVLMGVILRLASALYGAVLTGYHRNYIVHISQFLQIIAFAFSFFVLHTEGDILFNLSLAFTVGYIAELLLIIAVLAYINSAFLRVLPTFNITRLRQFQKKVLPYFMIDASLLGREPLIKCAIFISSGPSSVGIFELASKVPTAIRQAFVLGLNALMPAFINLAKEKVQSSIVILGQHSLRYIFWGAIGALFLYGLNSSRLLEIWLGSVNYELVTMTKLMTFWWIVTSLNVPAWWLGIGLDNGWTNTLIASTHLAYTLVLVGLSSVVSISSLTLVFLWILGGLCMQILLYTRIEFKTKMIHKIYLSKEMKILFTSFFVLAGITATVHSCVLKPSLSPNSVVLCSIFIFYFLFLIYRMLTNQRRSSIY